MGKPNKINTKTTGSNTAAKDNNAAEYIAANPISTRKLAWLLGIISFLLYINTINNGFVLDDLAVVKENAYVKQGISAIPKLLTTPYLKGFKRAADTAASNDLYRPLSLVMFATEHQVNEDSHSLNHFMNIALFAGCVILLFLFLDRLFDGKKTVVAFIAALLFAVHPIHTEVVANIKSRDELLCFFFAFSSLLLYIKFVRSGKTLHLAAGAFLYFLSLLSKETSASFLAVIPLVFFFYQNDNKRRSLYLTIASVASFAIYIVIRYSVLISYNANHTHIIDLMENELVGAPSVSSKFATAIFALGYYIRLLIIPYPLCSDYAYNTIPFVSFANLWVWLSIIAYTALAAVGLQRLIKNKKDPYAFGILLFLVTMALFSNIFFLVGAVVAERFLFFGSAGFCLVVALLFLRLLSQLLPTDKNILTSPKLWLAAGPVLLLFAILTINRNADWKDNYTLFKTDVKKFPANARLWYSLGFEITQTVIDAEPDVETKSELMKESIHAMQRSVSIYPNYSMSHNDLGNLFLKIKAYDSAETHLKRAIELNSKDPVNITDLGGLYFAQQKYPQAAAMCKKALQIEPLNTEIINNLALSFMQMKINDSALFYAGKVLDINRENILAQQIIATVKLQQNGIVDTPKTDGQ